MVCIFVGVGIVGVFVGLLLVIVLIFGGVGVLLEGIGLILGVDCFFDMCCIMFNVVGDFVVVMVILVMGGVWFVICLG